MAGPLITLILPILGTAGNTQETATRGFSHAGRPDRLWLRGHTGQHMGAKSIRVVIVIKRSGYAFRLKPEGHRRAMQRCVSPSNASDFVQLTNRSRDTRRERGRFALIWAYDRGGARTSVQGSRSLCRQTCIPVRQDIYRVLRARIRIFRIKE